MMVFLTRCVRRHNGTIAIPTAAQFLYSDLCSYKLGGIGLHADHEDSTPPDNLLRPVWQEANMFPIEGPLIGWLSQN
jgi:hypothetical protein